MLDVALQVGPVDSLPGDAELEQGVDLALRVVARERDQGPDQLFAGALVNRADHAEIDNVDPAAGLDEEVAGMRVGVVEAVPEDHLEHGVGPPPGDFRPVDAGRVQRGKVVDLDTADTLQGEHPTGGGLPEHLRKINVLVAGEILPKALGVLALPDVVGLGTQGLAELVDQADGVVLLGECPAPARGRGKRLENFQVLVDLID